MNYNISSDVLFDNRINDRSKMFLIYILNNNAVTYRMIEESFGYAKGCTYIKQSVNHLYKLGLVNINKKTMPHVIYK